jgi:transposase-like protein
MASEPTTLRAAIIYFASPDNCLNYLVVRRWPNGVVCPTCGSENVSFVPSRRLWQCKTRHAKCQFSVKVGTIFEDSPLGLSKWLPTVWMITNCKNGVSSWELHRAIGVCQKTAWFMLHRIRLAMQSDSGSKLGGQVEVDETFIGGKSRNMRKSKRAEKFNGPGGADKAIVFGMVERDGRVRACI